MSAYDDKKWELFHKYDKLVRETDPNDEAALARLKIAHMEEIASAAEAHGETGEAEQHRKWIQGKKESSGHLFLQEDIARLLEQPPSEEYMKEYQDSLDWDVGRKAELVQALASQKASAGRQDAAAQAYRQYAAAGPQIQQYRLQDQQNQLAEQAAAMAAGRGSMGARNAMMQSAQLGRGVATQGVGQMAEEDMRNQMGAMKALGKLREGAIGSAKMMSGIERDDDIYRHGRAKQSMDWLNMAEREKATYGDTLLKLLNATGQSGGGQPSMAGQVISGLGTAAMQTIPSMMNASGPGGYRESEMNEDWDKD